MTNIHVSQRGNSMPRISQETIDAVLSVPIIDLANVMGDMLIRKGSNILSLVQIQITQKKCQTMLILNLIKTYLMFFLYGRW
ncbi:hypothetical protein A1T07_22635 (plasmid) [Lysinibacillus sphaericus]|nr:hypothetical protein A1T07_22635 [Lysinibacillus sphaericus]